jgi:hypothetical protein
MNSNPISDSPWLLAAQEAKALQDTPPFVAKQLGLFPDVSTFDQAVKCHTWGEGLTNSVPLIRLIDASTEHLECILGTQELQEITKRVILHILRKRHVHDFETMRTRCLAILGTAIARVRQAPNKDQLREVTTGLTNQLKEEVDFGGSE